MTFSEDAYAIEIRTPADLTASQLERCLAIIAEGDAVTPAHAADKLPRAKLIAIALWNGEIVGVGAIKAPDSVHNAGTSASSSYLLSADIPETGYVAVTRDHQRHGLGRRLLAALLERHGGDVFGTTSNDPWKAVLASLGYIRVGNEWAGDHRAGKLLSLWLHQGARQGVPQGERPFHFEALPEPLLGWRSALERWGKFDGDISVDHFIPLTFEGRVAALHPFAPSLECWELLNSHSAFIDFMTAKFPTWTPRRDPTGFVVRHGHSISGEGVSIAPPPPPPPPPIPPPKPAPPRLIKIDTATQRRPVRRKRASTPPSVSPPHREQLDRFGPMAFRVEAIQGRYEYVQHGAWIDGEPIVVVTGRQDLKEDLVIKRGSVPYERCADVDLGAIFRELKYTGFACVDFKIKDGQPKIFEINPRLGGSLVLGPDLDHVMKITASALRRRSF